MNSCFIFDSHEKETGWLIGVGNWEFLPKRRFHCTFLLSLFTEQNIAAGRWPAPQTVGPTSFWCANCHNTTMIWDKNSVVARYDGIVWENHSRCLYPKNSSEIMFTLLLALIIHHYWENWTLQPGYFQVMYRIFLNFFSMTFLLELMASSKARITAWHGNGSVWCFSV